MTNQNQLKKLTCKKNSNQYVIPTQNCPLCGNIISALPGTRDAICQNCGYKDPCCE
jgi:transposase